MDIIKYSRKRLYFLFHGSILTPTAIPDKIFVYDTNSTRINSTILFRSVAKQKKKVDVLLTKYLRKKS